jgi:hypothetical protein
MAISEENYISIIQQAKELVPNFKYITDLKKKARMDYFDVYGIYLVEENLICLHKPFKYKTKLHFASTLYHEIAHWCMNHRNIGFRFKRKFSNVLARNTLEEIIAEYVARKICLELGYLSTKRNFDKYRLTKYKRDLKELEEELKQEFPRAYKNYYKEGLEYAKESSEVIVNYILNR